jgi:hypothetical protein
MGSDYHYQPKHHTDGLTGYPANEYGHLLDAFDKNSEGEYRELTSPYGALHFAVGNEDDFICMDYATITGKDGENYIVIDATINSETGCFIESFDYGIVKAGEGAANFALSIVDRAIEWLYMDPDSQIEHDKKGWNQDEYYFYRCVYVAEQNLCGDKSSDFSDEEKRFGSKKIDKYISVLS